MWQDNFTLHQFKSVSNYYLNYSEYLEVQISAMMGDYIWCLIREDDNAVHKKESLSNVHF